MTRLRLPAMTLAIVAGCFQASQAQQPVGRLDPHAVYEQRCNFCHNEHGADMARQRMRLDKERLVLARTGQELEVLLKRHHGVKLASGEWPALDSLFRLGLSTGGEYGLRCGRCHDRAVSLAREKLAIVAGRLVLKSNGQPVSVFLATHGEPTPAEIETLIRALTFNVETGPAAAAK